jgi:hypothetical protein
MISHLSQAIAQSKTNAMALVAHDDPVLLHRQVEAQVKAQINLENSLTRAIIGQQSCPDRLFRNRPLSLIHT